MAGFPPKVTQTLIYIVGGPHSNFSILIIYCTVIFQGLSSSLSLLFPCMKDLIHIGLFSVLNGDHEKHF